MQTGKNVFHELRNFMCVQNLEFVASHIDQYLAELQVPRVWDVFLSYSQVDAELVKDLHRHLTALGVRVQKDSGFSPLKSRATAFVVVLSGDSLEPMANLEAGTKELPPLLVDIRLALQGSVFDSVCPVFVGQRRYDAKRSEFNFGHVAVSKVVNEAVEAEVAKQLGAKQPAESPKDTMANLLKYQAFIVGGPLPERSVERVAQGIHEIAGGTVLLSDI
jgi:hypothetical protein